MRPLLAAPSRFLLRASTPLHATRATFRTSARNLTDTAPAAAAPVAKKPVGGFRGGIFGFLLGATLTGGTLYYTILADYKASNELLTEDICTLQSAVQRIEKYVQSLEAKVDGMGGKKKK
ncbi:MAG: hypothetical protein M1839_006257 [Geoglossum umbratile]|nr:MAG: hypothetical protein M1839_006257 [Geoglossum umbratile]